MGQELEPEALGMVGGAKLRPPVPHLRVFHPPQILVGQPQGPAIVVPLHEDLFPTRQIADTDHRSDPQVSSE